MQKERKAMTDKQSLISDIINDVDDALSEPGEPQKQTPLFENRLRITKNMPKSWYTFSPKIIPAYFGFYIFSILTISSMGITEVIVSFVRDKPINLFIVGFSILITAYLIIDKALKLSEKREHKRIAKQFEKDEWDLTLRFYDDDCFEVQGADGLSKRPYEHILHISEHDAHIRLWLKDRVYAVYKNNFTLGNADEFLDFAKEKCSAKQPLLSNAQKNMKHLRSLAFPIILLIVLQIIFQCFVWKPAFRPYIDSTNITAIEQMLTDWRETLNIIHSIDFDDGAVVFATETIVEPYSEYYMLNVYLYGKTTARFVDSHGYPITDLTSWSMWSVFGPLHESPGDRLTLNSGWSVVYGVIDADLWNDEVSETEKAKYTAVRFQHETIDAVLYYRIIENGSGA
jgi:hypothetical protein